MWEVLKKTASAIDFQNDESLRQDCRQLLYKLADEPEGGRMLADLVLDDAGWSKDLSLIAGLRSACFAAEDVA